MISRKANSKKPSDKILENLLDAVLVIDELGRIVYVNKSAETLFKKPASKLMNENFGFSVTPHEIQEIQIFNGKNIRTVQLLATTINWVQQEAFLMSLRDITEKKKMEEKLKKAFEELKIVEAELKKLNNELEKKVKERTVELEKKNSDLSAYSEHLKSAYRETESKVTFRNLELERKIKKLMAENEKLKSKSKH